MPKKPWEKSALSGAQEVGETKERVERNMRGILDQIKANPGDQNISSEKLEYWDRNFEAHARGWSFDEDEIAEYREAIEAMKKRRVQ